MVILIMVLKENSCRKVPPSTVLGSVKGTHGNNVKEIKIHLI